MVIYDLLCDTGHTFEGWFKNPEDWQSQSEQGLVECPMCGSGAVTRKLSAAKLTRKSNAQELIPGAVTTGGNDNAKPVQQLIGADPQAPEKYAKLQKMLAKVHDYVDQNFEDVGNTFAEKAIGMHNGELEHASIRGTATREQVKEMAEEGVEAMPLPPKPVDPEKLN